MKDERLSETVIEDGQNDQVSIIAFVVYDYYPPKKGQKIDLKMVF